MNATARRPIADDMPVAAIVLPKGFEAIWPAIRLHALAKSLFTARDIAQASGAPEARTEDYLLRLIKAGYVAKAGLLRPGHMLYQVVKAPHLAPMIDGRGRPDATHGFTDAVWRAVKMMKVFTFTSMLAHLDRRVPRETVSRYLTALERGGYLIGLAAVQECGEKQYKTTPSMMSGPLPPRLMQATFLFDCNRQAIADSELRAEEVRL